MEGLCGLLAHLNDFCQLGRVTKVLRPELIIVASNLHRQQMVSLVTCHQDGLVQADFRHFPVEKFQHSSSYCMIALKDAQPVMGTSRNQIQIDPMC